MKVESPQNDSLPDGFAYALVTRKKDDKSRYEIIDLDSGLRYADEPWWAITIKCIGIFYVVNPLYYLCYTVVHLVRLPLVTLANPSFQTLGKLLWKIARIPLFFFASQLAALCGIFSPIRGRALFGRVEYWLHDEKSHKVVQQKFEKLQANANLEDCRQIFCVVDNPLSKYLAPCMQAKGNVSDKDIKVEYLKGPNFLSPNVTLQLKCASHLLQ